jgi:hypothetical protein
MCLGEGYVLEKIDEIWIRGVKIIPFTNGVYTMCIYCMGTGDGDRQVLEQFKYVDLYENGPQKLEAEEVRALYNMRQIQKMAEEGTLRKSFIGKPARKNCYDWDFDFERMRKYPDYIILKAKEKEVKP